MCPNYDGPELIPVKIYIQLQIALRLKLWTVRHVRLVLYLQHLVLTILIRKLHWKPRPGRWKFDSSKMIGNHWWPQIWAVRMSWPMRGLSASSSDQSEARHSWQESSCWTLCPGRYFLLAAQTFKPKVIPRQTWPAFEFRMTWDLFPYFMIMKLNLFMACNEWSVKIIKSN